MGEALGPRRNRAPFTTSRAFFLPQLARFRQSATLDRPALKSNRITSLLVFLSARVLLRARWMESAASVPNSPSHPPQNGDISPAQPSATPDSTAPDQQIVPPYWGRQRGASTWSYASVEEHRADPISLQDNTVEGSEHDSAVWAKNVTIDSYVIVSGNVPGMGDYVVWNCTVETLDGGPMKIRKRYSEFDELRRKLEQTFPLAGASLPELPPKSMISRFRQRFLEKRKAGLSYFLNCVLLNPEFSASPVLKEFLFT
ncbi:uncharacterized protein K452DRAFT_282841 [Aplosporella prunicola CBS 121167]|uniref:Endosomal/vacuolar adapter protein YPT35 n=1 Tax=Aplosporella prunicola CBS 121167 TaxID=1176127 RepID=A0A6A6BTS1_9PEZI|nr:uncharacterized protein K452DRAFT_282841 [Aplosporella prunicola CBS 121167]KAF2146665.1 hypothetical protein K452DRAFT_282841 [Aplosporella prunicola CBS 121167]